MTSAPSSSHPWRRMRGRQGNRGSNSNPIDYFFPTLYTLAKLIEGEGQPPSLREMKEAGDFSSLSVVTYHISRLRGAGLVEVVPNTARAISITADGWRALDRPAPPDRRSSKLEAAVEEAIADLRAELAAGTVLSETSVLHIARRLDVALELARDAHD